MSAQDQTDVQDVIAALRETLAALKRVYVYESNLDSDEAEWVRPAQRAIKRAEALLAASRSPERQT